MSLQLRSNLHLKMEVNPFISAENANSTELELCADRAETITYATESPELLLTSSFDHVTIRGK